MKKLMIVMASLMAIILVSIFGVYIALSTKYAPQVVNFTLQKVFNQPIDVVEVDYSYRNPYYVQLRGVLLDRDATNPTYIPQLSLSLAPSIINDGKIQIDKLTLAELNFQHGLPDLSSFPIPFVDINQLSLVKLNFVHHDWVGRDIDVIIKQPHLTSSALVSRETQPEEAHTVGSTHSNNDGLSSNERLLSGEFPFTGEVQLSATQLYWQGEALDNVFIDADISEKKTVLYKGFFNWQHGNITVQAIKQNNQARWDVPKLTIDGVRLDVNSSRDNNAKTNSGSEVLSHSALYSYFNVLNLFPMDIEHFDIRNFSLETPHITANNITLSARNLTFPFEIWQQPNASLSIKANSMSMRGENVDEPRLDLTFSPNQIQINNLFLAVLQGDIAIKGEMTPDNIDLSELTMNNIKWIVSKESKQQIRHYLQELQQVHVKTLAINNVQYIDLNQESKFQITGLSINGSDSKLVSDGHWGLWNGKLNISASGATYDNISSRNLLVDMHANDGHFWLNQLFIPIDNGLLKGTADINFNNTLQPWNLNIKAVGMPLRLITRNINSPIELDGITDLTLKANGLYGNQLGFNHTVSGSIDASFAIANSPDDFHTLFSRNQGMIESTNADTDSSDDIKLADSGIRAPQPVTIGDLKLTADRGRMLLKPFNIKGHDFLIQVGGEYDFVNPDNGNIEYRLTGDCQELQMDLLGNKSDEVNVKNSCS